MNGLFASLIRHEYFADVRMLYRVICGCLSAATSANYPLQHPHIRISAFYPRPHQTGSDNSGTKLRGDNGYAILWLPRSSVTWNFLTTTTLTHFKHTTHKLLLSLYYFCLFTSSYRNYVIGCAYTSKTRGDWWRVECCDVTHTHTRLWLWLTHSQSVVRWPAVAGVCCLWWHYVACAFVTCLIKNLLTYLLTYLLSRL